MRKNEALTRAIISRMADGRNVQFFHDISIDSDVLVIDGLEQTLRYEDVCLSVAEFAERIVAPMLGILDATRPQPGWDEIASRLAVCG